MSNSTKHEHRATYIADRPKRIEAISDRMLKLLNKSIPSPEELKAAELEKQDAHDDIVEGVLLAYCRLHGPKVGRRMFRVAVNRVIS